MTHISVLFMYYITNFLYKETSIQQTVSIAIVDDANGSIIIEANGFVFYFAESPITDA